MDRMLFQPEDVVHVTHLEHLAIDVLHELHVEEAGRWSIVGGAARVVADSLCEPVAGVVVIVLHLVPPPYAIGRGLILDGRKRDYAAAETRIRRCWISP